MGDCGLECVVGSTLGWVSWKRGHFPVDSCTPDLYTVSSYVGQPREMNNIREDGLCDSSWTQYSSKLHYSNVRLGRAIVM